MYALQVEATSESDPCSYEATNAVAKKPRNDNCFKAHLHYRKFWARLG